jgi:hypothetical protein
MLYYSDPFLGIISGPMVNKKSSAHSVLSWRSLVHSSYVVVQTRTFPFSLFPPSENYYRRWRSSRNTHTSFEFEMLHHNTIRQGFTRFRTILSIPD